jgi:PAS domain S-box-containing protein
VLLDITAEREAAAALDRSEARYRGLLEQLPVVVYMDAYGAAEHSRYVSPNVLDLLGHPAEAFVKDTRLWFDLVHPDDRERAQAAWRAGWDGGVGWAVEYRYVHPDGHDVWVRDDARMVIDPKTGESTWRGVITDLTAEKQAELDLHRSEQRYRALVEHVPAVVYEMGPDDERRTLFVSPHVEEILGYPRQEWLDQPDIWVELLHPDDREQELEAHDRHNETGEPWQREYRLTASDGRDVWVRDHAQLVLDADGPRWLGVMLDITLQKDAEELLRLANDELEMRVLTRTAELEEANEMMSLEIGERRRIEVQLREAERRYHLLVEDLPAAVYSWEANWEDDRDIADVELYTSRQLEAILGFPREEWHRPGFWQERLHPHDRDRILPLAEHSIQTGEPFSAEYRYLAADGRVVWVLDRATLRTRDARGRPRLFQGVMLDITELKNAEAKALEAEERFRRLAERGPFVVYEYELEHGDPPTLHMRYVSPSAKGLLGTPIDRWSGELGTWLEHMHPDDVERMTEIAHEAFATGGPWSHAFRMIASDGRVVWLLDRGRAIGRDELGRPNLFQGMFLDITDEQEARLKIETSEARYRSVVETMPAVPWSEVVDPETGQGRYVFIGPQVESVFGYTPSELLMEPDHFFRLVHPDDRERLKAASDRCDRTGEAWDELYRVTHRDGSLHWIYSYADRTFEQGRPVWHGIAIDVTRRVSAGRFPVPVGEAAEPGSA